MSSGAFCIAGCSHGGGASDHRRAPERLYSNVHKTSCLIHLRFPGMAVFIGNGVEAEHWFLGTPSAKSKSALRQGMFRLCPGKVSYFRFSFCEILTQEARNDLAKPWKSMLSKEIGSKHFPTGSHASQHRISVPRCLFLQARNAVEAFNSLAPRVSGVLRESSRTVFLLAFSRKILKSASVPNGSAGY